MLGLDARLLFGSTGLSSLFILAASFVFARHTPNAKTLLLVFQHDIVPGGASLAFLSERDHKNTKVIEGKELDFIAFLKKQSSIPIMNIGDRWGVKNRTADVTAVTIAGNGSNIEDPTVSFALAASFSLVGDGAAVEWEFDGTQWLVI